MRIVGLQSEAELIARAREGDKDAFEELVRRNAERLQAVILRFTGNPREAEDITQETFLRAWRSIGRFQGRSQFFTWLFRIGINEAKRHAERRKRQELSVPLEESPLERAPDWSNAPELRAEQSELAAVLRAAIDALEPAYGTPLVLRDVAGLSTREAAEVMELGESAFKSRLHRARMAVRRALDEYFSESEE